MAGDFRTDLDQLLFQRGQRSVLDLFGVIHRRLMASRDQTGHSVVPSALTPIATYWRANVRNFGFPPARPLAPDLSANRVNRRR